MERPIRYIDNGEKILKVTEDGLRINVYKDVPNQVRIQMPHKSHSDYKKGL